MSGLAQQISGNVGRVTIPTLGSVIGVMTQWTLRRRKRGDDWEPGGLWDLQASLSHFTVPLFDDPDYDHEILVTIDRRSGKQYRLEQAPDHKTVAAPHSLLVEGVALCRVE